MKKQKLKQKACNKTDANVVGAGLVSARKGITNSKTIANAVGVAPLGDPHFEEHAKNTPKASLNPNSNISLLTSNHRGITLIALIITIIVMLILVGVTINVALNGGLFGTAREGANGTQIEADRETLLSAVIGALEENGEVDFYKLDANLPDGFIGSEGSYTSKVGNNFTVDKNGGITTLKPVEVTVTVGGKAETITKDNVRQYMGKVVTNYKNEGANGTEEITIGTTTYTVSTKYRLYYVDFEGKYGDEGTVYLKAECIGNGKALQRTIPGETDVVVIKELNPGLYPSEDNPDITPPSEGDNKMKSVAWLTNTENWKDLIDENFASETNYVVGAPSLEMMMDSYNTYYGLTNGEKNTESLSSNSPRVRLFYQYPYQGSSNNYGYGVGPSNNSSASDGYYTSTSNYSVQAKKENEEDIGTMYYPGTGNNYWLASPSALNSDCLMDVSSTNRR